MPQARPAIVTSVSLFCTPRPSRSLHCLAATPDRTLAGPSALRGRRLPHRFCEGLQPYLYPPLLEASWCSHHTRIGLADNPRHQPPDSNHVPQLLVGAAAPAPRCSRWALACRQASAAFLLPCPPSHRACALNATKVHPVSHVHCSCTKHTGSFRRCAPAALPAEGGIGALSAAAAGCSGVCGISVGQGATARPACRRGLVITGIPTSIYGAAAKRCISPMSHRCRAAEHGSAVLARL